MGLLYFQIWDKIKTYYGIDFSESFISKFQSLIRNNKKYNNVDLYCGDIKDFCKQNQNKFDLITTLDFSEHIYDEDFLSIYSSIKLALKKDGKLILHTPNKSFILEWLKEKGIMNQLKEHIGVRDAKEHINLLKKCGFKNVYVKFIPHYTVLKHIHFLSYIPFIGQFFQARILIEAT